MVNPNKQTSNKSNPIDLVDLFYKEKIDFKEGLLRLSAKCLMLKTYYELYQKYNDDFEYEEKLDLFLHSFNTFLNRKKEHFPRHYIYYMNLTGFIKKLFMLHFEIKINKVQLKSLQNGRG